MEKRPAVTPGMARVIWDGNSSPHLYLRGARLVTLPHVVNARSTDVLAIFKDCPPKLPLPLAATRLSNG
eukprot:4361777-Pyramimonas_sp.AAC.1